MASKKSFEPIYEAISTYDWYEEHSQPSTENIAIGDSAFVVNVHLESSSVVGVPVFYFFSSPRCLTQELEARLDTWIKQEAAYGYLFAKFFPAMSAYEPNQHPFESYSVERIARSRVCGLAQRLPFGGLRRLSCVMQRFARFVHAAHGSLSFSQSAGAVEARLQYFPLGGLSIVLAGDFASQLIERARRLKIVLG